MPFVTEDCPEVDSLRLYHDGPFGRCPQCGRKVFLPCLACETEATGKVSDPVDATEEEPLYVQLEGEFRQRYEYFHLEKVAEAIRSGA